MYHEGVQLANVNLIIDVVVYSACESTWLSQAPNVSVSERSTHTNTAISMVSSGHRTD